MMKTSILGINLIKEFEGFRANKYFCPAGKETIGYGHVIKIHENIPTTITKAEAEQLLRKDLVSIEYFINKVVTAPLTQGQFDALVSLAYNWGTGNLGRSQGLRKLNRGDYAGALKEFKQVNKVRGIVFQGLVRRRDAEAKLWNSKVNTQIQCG